MILVNSPKFWTKCENDLTSEKFKETLPLKTNEYDRVNDYHEYLIPDFSFPITNDLNMSIFPYEKKVKSFKKLYISKMVYLIYCEKEGKKW